MEKESISMRIKKIIETENVTIAGFERIIGAGSASILSIIKRNSNVSGDILSKILSTFPLLDANWLILGKGSMYLFDNHSKPMTCRDCVILKRTIENLNDSIDLYKHKVSDLETRLRNCEKKALQT